MKRGCLAFGFLILFAGHPAMAAKDASDKSAASSGSRVKRDVPNDSTMGLSRGVDRLLDEIYRRQKALTEAEREVARREVAVGELELLVEQRIAALEGSRRSIEERIAAWETVDGDRIKKLSKVYAAMPTVKAARLLEALDLDLAVAVLGKMRQKNSAPILAAIAPTRALTMSKRMVRPLSAPPPGQAR